MSLYQLIFDALVESWILCAGWENRWMGVSAWFSAVGWIPGEHSLDLQFKTVKIPSLLNWMENMLLNPMKQIHFKIPACPQVPLLKSCLPTGGPGMLPRGFLFLRRLLSVLSGRHQSVIIWRRAVCPFSTDPLGESLAFFMVESRWP